MSCEKSFLKGERHVFSQMAGGGGGDGEGGGADGGGDMKRGPQSVQSVPYAQLVPVAPSPPSWQNLLVA